jgi:hypothetical protein
VDEGEIKVIDCTMKKMWAYVMMKPLQGTAFKIMHAELMNCPLEYKDPPLTTGKANKEFPMNAMKMVTWKSVVMTPFKAPQECVGHNRVSNKKPGLDRHLEGRRHPCRNMTNRLGVARLTTGMWQVGDAGARKWRQ